MTNGNLVKWSVVLLLAATVVACDNAGAGGDSSLASADGTWLSVAIGSESVDLSADLDIGYGEIGGSDTTTLTVTNASDATVTLSGTNADGDALGVFLGGADAAQFSLDTSAVPASLAPNASFDVVLDFVATGSPGRRTATVSIRSNADSEAYDLTIVGAAGSAEITVEWDDETIDPIVGDPVYLGEPTTSGGLVQTTLTVTNSGTYPLKISRAVISDTTVNGTAVESNPGDDINEFFFVQTPDLSAIDPGSTRDIIVGIQKDDTYDYGTVAATLTLSTNATASGTDEFEISLSATLYY